MKCKKENIDKLVESSIWYLDDNNHPRHGVITEAIYDEVRNDVIVTIQKDTPKSKLVQTERYLSRHCYKTLDELFDHTVNAYDADRQKFVNKIKDELKYEIFYRENGAPLTYKAMYILLDYYANKQIKNYDELDVFYKIRDEIISYMDKAIDKICEDIK